jgi:Skp family chaperone for outer membrane proteins
MSRPNLHTNLAVAAWVLFGAGLVSDSSLVALSRLPYLDLLDRSMVVPHHPSEFQRARKQLEAEKTAEKQRLDNEYNHLQKRVAALHKRLDAINRAGSHDTEAQSRHRQELHEQLRTLQTELRQKDLERRHGLESSYDNRFAKLDLLEQWPARQREIERTIASGTARQRRHGNIEDVGVRQLDSGDPSRDIKLGDDSLRELRMYGLLPTEFTEPEVSAYIQALAAEVARNSDLRIPLRTTILLSKEVNAFALPGGLLFINTGLIERAGSEAELVGVIAHETAHITARHGPRLLKRAQIAGVVYQVAQVAALIFTGGTAGIGTYYALQYGFFGLGMALDLTLLGVSREFEAEADQLGVQYAWKAGYDPKGFISFFDTMASESGYVQSASWFRTHPPFFERIVSTFSEIAYLPPGGALRTDSSRFQQMKIRLKAELQKHHKNEPNAPSLYKRKPS